MISVNLDVPRNEEHRLMQVGGCRGKLLKPPVNLSKSLQIRDSKSSAKQVKNLSKAYGLRCSTPHKSGKIGANRRIIPKTSLSASSNRTRMGGFSSSTMPNIYYTNLSTSTVYCHVSKSIYAENGTISKKMTKSKKMPSHGVRDVVIRNKVDDSTQTRCIYTSSSNKDKTKDKKEEEKADDKCKTDKKPCPSPVPCCKKEKEKCVMASEQVSPLPPS